MSGPTGEMDNASASGAEDSRFESWQGRTFDSVLTVITFRQYSIYRKSTPLLPSYYLNVNERIGFESLKILLSRSFFVFTQMYNNFF